MGIDMPVLYLPGNGSRYADASLEKSAWPEVMKGLAWCKQQLEQESTPGVVKPYSLG